MTKLKILIGTVAVIVIQIVSYLLVIEIGISSTYLLLTNLALVIIIVIIILRFTDSSEKSIHELIRVIDNTLNNISENQKQLYSPGILGLLENKIAKLLNIIKHSNNELIEEKLILKDYISDISHQLKTPLTSIQINNELLLSANVSEIKKKEIISHQMNLITTMSELVRNLLKLSKLEMNVMDYELESYDIKDILEGSIESVKPMMQKDNVTIESTLISSVIYTDKLWLNEAIVNVLKNAIEHSPNKGNVTLYTEDNPIYILIRIQDEGLGVSKGKEKIIFKRFYKKQSMDNDSVGIGLSLTKRILENLNGEIYYDNSLEKGSFVIKIYKV